MEINTEINKVFGQEMAKLFAAQISEEEMLAKAKDVWRQMQYDESPSWNRKGSELDNAIKQHILSSILAEVDVVTSTDKFKEECNALAVKLVEDVRQNTYDKIVEEVSNRLAAMSFGSGYGLNMRAYIEQIIMETLHR